MPQGLGDEERLQQASPVGGAAAGDGGPSAAGASRTMRSALRYRDFRLILAAQTVSSSGDWFYNVALFVFVLERTHSASWVGAASVVRLLPRLLVSPFAGVIADRLDRRRLMIGCDLIRMGLMVMLGIAIQISWFPVAAVLALVFISTAAGSPYWIASDALNPSILGEADLPAANAWIQVTDNTAVLVGPALGAVVLAVSSPSIGFFVNAVTFLVSALLVVAVRVPHRAGQGEQSTIGVVSNLRAGASALLSLGLGQRIGLMYYFGDWMLFGASLVVFGLVAAQLLRTGVSSYGYLLAGVAAGGVGVASVAVRLGRFAQPTTVLAAAMVAMGMSFASLALFHNIWLAVLLCAVTGAGNVLLDVVLVSWLQRSLPSDVLGRCFGLLESLQAAAMILGSLIAPPLVIWLGLRGSLLTLGLPLGLALPLVGATVLRTRPGAANPAEVVDTGDAVRAVVEVRVEL